MMPAPIAEETTMSQYQPPLRDMQFVLHELLGATQELKARSEEHTSELQSH